MSPLHDPGEQMHRREFVKIVLSDGAGALLSQAFGRKLSAKGLDGVLTLPPPVINTFSTEIALNSRLSCHSGYSGVLPDQIPTNILWVCDKAPMLGANRTIYAARADNVYRYDPNRHVHILMDQFLLMFCSAFRGKPIATLI